MKDGISITIHAGRLTLAAIIVGAAALLITTTRKAEPTAKPTPKPAPGLFGRYGQGKTAGDEAVERAMQHGAKVARASFEARMKGRQQ